MHMYERVKNKRNVFNDFFLYEIYPNIPKGQLPLVQSVALWHDG